MPTQTVAEQNASSLAALCKMIQDVQETQKEMLYLIRILMQGLRDERENKWVIVSDDK